MNRILRRRKKLRAYIPAEVEDADEDDEILPDDFAELTFFQTGREFESTYTSHSYTKKEQEKLSEYESFDYLSPQSDSYQDWLRTASVQVEWDRWLMMGLIGFAVGVVGWLLHQFIDLISETKFSVAGRMIVEGNFGVAWIFTIGYSMLFVLVSASLVVFFRPSAGGSGMPELIGFLNGSRIRKVFSFKTMIIKFLSCVCAVGSGLPIGPEGPMIHLGGLVGAGLSQLKSDTFKIKLPILEKFRNPKDRRDFINAGVGAGVSAAFGSPVGGLLFAMEEVASFWSIKQSWMTFFCCMVSTATTDLFNSAFDGFKYAGEFGAFKEDKYIIFQVKRGISINLVAFIPSIILGIIGGILGAFFTFLNVKIRRYRSSVMKRIKNKRWKTACKIAEPVLIMAIMATISVFLPAAFPCTPFRCRLDTDTSSPQCLTDRRHPLHLEPNVQLYTCEAGVNINYNDTTVFYNRSYSQVATLMFVTGEEAIKHLLSRNTHLEFDFGPLIAILVIYFLLSCWSSGTSVASGLVVPMLLIGSLYGRIVGRIMVHMFGIHRAGYWTWIDPGAFALIGSASFFAGVSRLTMSLTVIMMEITNDVQFLLCIMTAVIIAKWVGDTITHSLYHALMEMKCIPFLNWEPVILHNKKDNVSIELFTAGQIMAKNPLILRSRERVADIAKLLLNCQHCGFPIVKEVEGTEIVCGIIKRPELNLIMLQEDLFESNEASPVDVPVLDYQQFIEAPKHLEKPNEGPVKEALEKYCHDEKYNDLYIDLAHYYGQSPICVPESYSLYRVYALFRTLGLRHLIVTDTSNRISGIITRKDLMGHSLEERLEPFVKDALKSEMKVTGDITQELDNNNIRDTTQELKDNASGTTQELKDNAGDTTQELGDNAGDS
ncbi:uncharacterized protein TRIADDRAFT_54756 [Trichoplax adhaerens]|uniref:Chloride channel protein n=1 Tax=Trichoplax adhaerens TaxID=10228 RepID=B3RSW9_TRIAD|nr:hypothetical protein TRIADDRAFT_54756 [Trichoplax adhaerens]EDV27121.1 hypothetical protein TRIADDRAFT_54756 [Trichoplax adhaerens]|eukprot:XP_002111117.1 hypothetical protein TRIADDRAFT_54756 [Trichoplax adhaerens]